MLDKIENNLLNSLTAQERIILADMWEDGEKRQALIKLMGNRQFQLAQLTLRSSADHYYTVENRGRANELTHLERVLTQNLRQENKRRNSANVE